MLTLEEAIRPILDRGITGYKPVAAREGKHHWFVYFGFDGQIAAGDVPYVIDKETGELGFFPIPYFIRQEEPSPIELEMGEGKEVPVHKSILDDSVM